MWVWIIKESSTIHNKSEFLSENSWSSFQLQMQGMVIYYFIISHSLLFKEKTLYDLKQTVALHIWFELINWYKKMYFHRNSSLHLCRFSLFFILFWIRQICSIQFHLWFFMWFYCGVVYIKLGRTLIIYHTIIIITASVHQQFMPSSLFCHLTNKSF